MHTFKSQHPEGRCSVCLYACWKQYIQRAEEGDLCEFKATVSSSTAGVVIQRNSALKNKTAIKTTKIERSYGFRAGNLRTHSPSPRSVLKLEELSDAAGRK